MQNKRYFLELAYHGSTFHGWQIQNNAKSVQEVLQKALSQLFNQAITIIGSGRTDTGVHASQQFAHFDLPDSALLQDPAKTKYALNRLLPNSIAIKHIYSSNTDLHARFHAVRRSYQYHIIWQKDPFKHQLATLYYQNFDLDLMNEASKYLLGKQDFESFSKAHTDVQTFICEIFETKWEKTSNGYIFHISANRFLRGMVRAIVGTLLDVGLKKYPPQTLKSIIEAKDRKKAGHSVPAEGLYLSEVTYPKNSLNLIS